MVKNKDEELIPTRITTWRRVGLGMIVHDSMGRVVAALSEPRPYLLDSTTAEVLATWRMAEVCSIVGQNIFILEGDSLEIVQAL